MNQSKPPSPDPIRSLAEHRLAVAELIDTLRQTPDAISVALGVERIVRLEVAQGIDPKCGLISQVQGIKQTSVRRTALISDIHGNYEGLMAVLNDVKQQRCDNLVCLGDIVDGGPENDLVVQTLSDLGAACALGNHDQYNDLALKADSHRYLEQLPEQIIEHDILFTHISPRPVKRKIDHAVEVGSPRIGTM